MRRLALALPALALAACAQPQDAPASGTEDMLVAGGCFWCVEADFEKQPGVVEVISGYAGGESADPTYKTYEADGHREVARIVYDPARTDYATLAATFLRTIDVTDAGGQFCDRGYGYSSAIYYETEAERAAAQAAIAAAEEKLGREVVTPVEAEPPFYAAEDYHQDYYKSDDRILSRFGYVTKARAYEGYRRGCGRDARLAEVWGDAAVAP